MKKCFINGVSSISAQNSFDNAFLSDVTLQDNENVLYAIQPSYKDFIPPAAIRRMAKGVKMGIATASKALKEANVEVPDAIITGTGMGCVEDSEKFLKAIIANDEQFLTPTSFIQSTHNTVGAQIALGMHCYGYNFTYVNGAVSFESALIDATLQIENEEANSILVGGVDEIADHTILLYKLINLIKREEDKPYLILESNSKGIVFSEGASFFVLENVKKESTYAEIKAITIVNNLKKRSSSDFILSFLKENNLEIHNVDAILLGNNGDIEFDEYYENVQNVFKNTSQAYYKHLSGEFNTASSFGFWIASNILKNQEIPEILSINSLFKKEYKNLLLYNQYKGKDHSLILLQKC